MYQTLEAKEIKDILKPLGLVVEVLSEGQIGFYEDEHGEQRVPHFTQFMEQRANTEDLREIASGLLRQIQQANNGATAIIVRHMALQSGSQIGYALEIRCALVRRKEDLEGAPRFEDYAISGEQVKFGIALEALKNGFRVRRESWAPDTFIYLVPGSQFVVNRAPLLGIYPEGTEIVYAPHIDIKSGANHCQVWQVSQDAMLAEDWIICMRGA